MAKTTKPNVVRGQIFDAIATAFGNSVLGMYDGKLRIEILNEVGQPVQFSLAPVVHKTLIDEAECDELVPIEEQLKNYENQTKTKTKAKAKAKTSSKKEETKVTEGEQPSEQTPESEVALSGEEQAKLDKLNALLDAEF